MGETVKKLGIVAILSALVLLAACTVSLADGIDVIEFKTYIDGTVHVVEQNSIADQYTGGDGFKVNNYMVLTPWTFVMDPSGANTDLTDDQIINAWREGMAEWNDHLATNLFSGNHTRGSVAIQLTSNKSTSNIANYNGINTISFANLEVYETGLIAKTFVYVPSRTKLSGYPVDKQALETDVVFNSALFWTDVSLSRYYNGYDLQSIATHEFGHTLGLGDITDSRFRHVTMYQYGQPNDLSQRTLDQLDLIGLSKLYNVPGYGGPTIATPSPEPTATATPVPTATPTVQPTDAPTIAPTAVPTAAPTVAPTATARPTATPAPVLTATVTTAGGSLNLRANASTNGQRITTIPNGTVLTVLQRGSEWSQVKYNSYVGYVVNTYLRFNSSTTPAPATPTVRPTTAPTSAPTGSAPTTAPTASTQTATVNVNTRLNMRSQASTSSAVVTQLPRGAVVTVISRVGDWSRISYQNYNGYVMSSYLIFQSASPTARPTATPAPTTRPTATPAPTGSGSSTTYIGVVRASRLNMRSARSTSSSVITQIPNGAEVVVTGSDGEWCSVKYNSYAGYVAARYLEIYRVTINY